MTALSFNPAFHTTLLSTLREGVIHLALPQPEIARQPDFPAQALQDLLGVTPRSRLNTRFEAATDLIQFATRNLADADRPSVLAPLWGTENWKPDTALMKGVFHYLEGVTQEACQVLGENSFQLSLQVWNEPDNLENWEILADHIEAQEIGWVGRRLHREPFLSERLRRNFPEDLLSFKSLSWMMGFLDEASATAIHPRALLRLQLVPETRLLMNLTYHMSFKLSGVAETLALVATLPGSRVTALSLGSHHIGDTGTQTLAGVLPRSQVTELDLNFNRIGDDGTLALAQTLAETQVTELRLNSNQIGDTGVQALADSLPRSRITLLDLRDNQIGDDGVLALAQTLSGSQITELDLRDNRISYAMQQELREVARRTGITIRWWENP